MIVLICGGRDYYGDVDILHDAHPVSMVVHGDAKGADRRGGLWAKSRHIHYAAVPALWDELGRNAAGPMRNAAMLLLKPTYCVAFPGGSGTADMVRRCNEAGITVWQPYGA